MVFLAFDVFFLIFCIAMACIVFFVLFCCFPILATVAYAMSIGEGASESDIRSLPKYMYRQQNAIGTFISDKKQEDKLIAPSGNSFSKSELILRPEDSVSISIPSPLLLETMLYVIYIFSCQTSITSQF